MPKLPADVLNFPPPLEQPVPPDQAEREQAVDAGGSYLVQAPAGSGKTSLLTERFLRLLCTVEDPEQVLAITFTHVAVEEMRSRIVAALNNAAANVPLSGPAEARSRSAALAALARSSALGWDLLNDPQLLNIKTIDGLCLQIASQTPLTSRLGPGLAPTENGVEFANLAAMRTLQKIADIHSPDEARRLVGESAATMLRHRDNNLQACAQLLASMLINRDQWWSLFPLDRDSLTDQQMDNELRPRLEALLSEAAEQPLRTLSEMLLRDSAQCQELVKLLVYACGNVEDGHVFRNCEAMVQLPAAQAEFQPQWEAIATLMLNDAGKPRRSLNKTQGFPPTSISPSHKARALALIGALCADTQMVRALAGIRALLPARYTDEEWHLTKALFRLLQDSLVELELLFASAGAVDFVGVQLAALAALEASADHPSDLAFSLGGRYRHLLVDEFQDTSVNQQHLLRLLLQGWGTDEGRTVFLVGDPMQSIYLFRQAELRGFAEVRDNGLGELPVNTLKLRVNFRSQPRLIEQHNAIFTQVFQGQDIEFVAAEPFDAPASDPAVTWHFSQSPARGSGLPATHNDVQAQEMVALVRQALDAGIKEIAILVRVKTHACLVMELLRAGQVEFRAVDMEPLNERQEVLDVFALTCALLHPADRIAWLSVLRAPWCGLGLGALDAMFGTTPRHAAAAILTEQMPLLAAEDRSRVAHVASVLHNAAACSGSIRLPQRVWQAWQCLHGADCLNQEQYANVMSYFAMLEKLDMEGLAQRDNIERDMGKLCATPNPRPGVCVEVMSIHKAKGREWDVVIVPHMERQTARTQHAAIEWMESGKGDGAIYVAPLSGTGQENSPLGTWIRRHKQEREIAEVRRLLYVAATRARRTLHLLGSVSIKRDGTISKPQENTLLAAAWPWAQQLAEDALAGQRPVPLAEPKPQIALAAVAKPQRFRRLPQRMFDRQVDLPLQATRSSAAPSPARSQGFSTRTAASNDARLTGTTLHALLQHAAALRTASKSKDWNDIAHWLQGSGPRVRAALISSGMPARHVNAAVSQILQNAQTAAASLRGQWVMENHPGSSSELNLTLMEDGLPRALRIDRVFSAGPVALSSGDSHVWIVDYKSAQPDDAEHLQDFLARQTQDYSETMQKYARALAAAQQEMRPICCALYFPALDILHIISQ